MDTLHRSDTAEVFTLSRLPVELLALLTSHFPAFYLVTALYMTGDTTLGHKLKHGGVVKVTLSAVDDSKTQFGDWLRFPAVSEIVVSGYNLQKLANNSLIAGLPKNLRKLRVDNAEAAKLLLSSWTNHLRRFGRIIDHEATSSPGNLLFPHLESLDFAHSTSPQLQGPIEALLPFLSSLPPSLTHLHLPTTNLLLSDQFHCLPPNVTHLRGLDLAIPTSDNWIDFPSASSLVCAQFSAETPFSASPLLPVPHPSSLRPTLPIHIPLPSLCSLYLNCMALEHSLIHLLQITELNLYVTSICADVLFSAIPASLGKLCLSTQNLDLINDMEDISPHNCLKILRLDCRIMTAKSGQFCLDRVLGKVPHLRVLEITPTYNSEKPSTIEQMVSSVPQSMRLEKLSACVSPSFFNEASPSLQQAISQLNELTILGYDALRSIDSAYFYIEHLHEIPASIKRWRINNLRSKINPAQSPSTSGTPSSSSTSTPWQ